MKKMMLAILLCLSTALMGQSSSAKIPSPIQSLEWLVGGVWTTDMSKMGNGMKSIETRYTWSDNGAFLRFNTHFVTDKGTIKRYDGNFYYDSDKKTLAMWYMDSENKIYQGPIKADGDLTTFDFRGEDFEGKMADLRVVVTRKSNSLYNWALSESDGGKRKQLATLDYIRKEELKTGTQVGEKPLAVPQLRPDKKEKSMGAVTGLGGAFLRTKDPKKLYAWYLEHLRLPGEHGSFNFPAENQTGSTVLSFFSASNDYFPTTQHAMLNFRVDNLDAVRTRLISEGVEVDPKVQDESYGRFGWFTDPEGNRVELWQPL